MHFIHFTIVATLLAFSAAGTGCQCGPLRQRLCERFGGALQPVVADHRNYYSPENAGCLAGGLGTAAVFAHTDLDQEIRDAYQDHARNGSTDDMARAAKVFGEGEYVVAAGGAAYMLGRLCPEGSLGDGVGTWGDRSLRSLIVGVPPLLFVQSATGASRPGESSAESDWVPFHDDNGASGHAFMGAVPFITAAKMSDNCCVKTACYAVSAMPAWSRINDDNHYTSQVILGWWMAYLACESVARTERESEWYLPEPTVTSDGSVGLGYTWSR